MKSGLVLNDLFSLFLWQLCVPFWNMAAVFGIPKGWFFKKKLKKFRKSLIGL